MGGNSRGHRRRFGAVRKLPSGRFQARYKGPDDAEHTAPQTFASKTDAEIWLTRKEAEIHAQEWADPDAGKILFRDYAASWLAERTLRPKTAQLYEGVLRLHIFPALGHRPLSEITSRHVRQWHTKLVNDGPGASTVAKAYRLVRGILNTAVEDDLIKKNPCRIKNAGVERPVERPVLTVLRSSRWPARCLRGSVRWCCWRPSAVCGGVSWRRFAGAISISMRGRSGLMRRCRR